MLQALEPLKGEKGEINLNKLPPPKIDNILPAFVETNNNKVEILIPYELNMSIKDGDFDKIKYIIRSSTINKEIKTGTINIDRGQRKLTLSLSKNLFILGQYYNIQIAFVSGSSVGYFSNVGVSRYINKPTLSVSHINLREVIGTFSDELTNESVYSYQFNLYDDFNNIIETSGLQIHNNINDSNINTTKDSWEIQTTLQADILYKLEYQITTINNYSGKSNQIGLSFFETLPPQVDSELLVENEFEEGCNNIYLKRFFTDGNDRHICGNFFLLRSSNLDNYKKWEKLIDFQIYDWTFAESRILNIYKDYFIEQGKSYRYAIQAYNSNGIYSTKLLNANGPVYSDFEYMFLGDGERQLKIKFNPKMSSFKSTVLESKIDTIGGQHPFFFKNGNVNYKEFPISGLLSLTSDENQRFIISTEDNNILAKDKTSLNHENIYNERMFKLEVLNWLNNGEFKYFKSPTEGNYIVRLMNSSLTPNDTLGRMLHNFSSTAYEVADYTLKDLKNFNFLNKSNKAKRKYKEIILANNNNDISLDTNIKVDQAIIYTAPDLNINYTLRGEDNPESMSLKSNKFGIINFLDYISDKGLSTISKANWGPDSKLNFSYLNIVEDKDIIKKWIFVKSVPFNNQANITINGKGFGQSIKESLNSNTVIISHFPYISVSKRNWINIKKSGADYVYATGDKKNQKVIFDSSKLYKINDTNEYIDGAAPDKTIKESSAFSIYFDQDFFNLKNDVITNNGTRVFRDINDFSCGQGLSVSIQCIKKTLTLKTPVDVVQDPTFIPENGVVYYTYAI